MNKAVAGGCLSAVGRKKKKLLILIYTLWKKDEVWQQNKYPGLQPASQEPILIPGVKGGSFEVLGSVPVFYYFINQATKGPSAGASKEFTTPPEIFFLA